MGQADPGTHLRPQGKETKVFFGGAQDGDMEQGLGLSLMLDYGAEADFEAELDFEGLDSRIEVKTGAEGVQLGFRTKVQNPLE